MPWRSAPRLRRAPPAAAGGARCRGRLGARAGGPCGPLRQRRPASPAAPDGRVASAGLRNLLIVGCGGFVGTIGRYLVGGWAHRSPALSTFPFGTLVVNVTGCFLIGVLGALSASRQLFGPEARLFLLIGLLGGYTTFSSFAYETLALARDAELLRAFVNVSAQMVLGLAAS